jgi:hypothetical protein
MVYVPRTRKSRAAPKRRMYRKRRGVGPKAIKSIARSVMDQRLEKKMVTSFVSNYPLSPYNSGDYNLGVNTVSMICLSPNNIAGTFPSAPLQIQQGVASNQRVGQSIQCKKGEVRLYFVPNGYNTSYNFEPSPMILQVFIGYDKTTGDGQPSAALTNFFLTDGGATNPTGQAIDTFRKINRSRYAVFNRRTYKIGQAEFFGTANQPTQQYYTNNDFKYNIKTTFDYTKHLIKNCKYPRGGTDDTPNTRQLWMWWMISPANGLSTASSRNVTINAEATIHYTDA